MNKDGPIIIIEDDVDDQDLMKIAFARLALNNSVHFFYSGELALQYLQFVSETPFIIIADVNMPMAGGLEIRNRLFNNPLLKHKLVPYLLFSTDASQDSIVNAYSDSIQGFFEKPYSLDDLVVMLRNIITYWQSCKD